MLLEARVQARGVFLLRWNDESLCGNNRDLRWNGDKQVSKLVVQVRLLHISWVSSVNRSKSGTDHVKSGYRGPTLITPLVPVNELGKLSRNDFSRLSWSDPDY